MELASKWSKQPYQLSEDDHEWPSWEWISFSISCTWHVPEKSQVSEVETDSTPNEVLARGRTCKHADRCKYQLSRLRLQLKTNTRAPMSRQYTVVDPGNALKRKRKRRKLKPSILPVLFLTSFQRKLKGLDMQCNRAMLSAALWCLTVFLRASQESLLSALFSHQISGYSSLITRQKHTPSSQFRRSRIFRTQTSASNCPWSTKCLLFPRVTTREPEIWPQRPSTSLLEWGADKSREWHIRGEGDILTGDGRGWQAKAGGLTKGLVSTNYKELDFFFFFLFFGLLWLIPSAYMSNTSFSSSLHHDFFLFLSFYTDHNTNTCPWPFPTSALHQWNTGEISSVCFTL